MKRTVTLAMDGYEPRTFEVDGSIAFVPREYEWEPDLRFVRDEFRAMNGRLDRLPATVGPGSVTVESSSGTLSATIVWFEIHDGGAKYNRMNPPKASRIDARDKAFRGYLTSGEAWDPVTELAGGINIGPDPDVGDPGAAGSSRLRFPAPATSRALAAGVERNSLQMLAALHCWVEDQYDRCFHYYHLDGTPWKVEDGGRVGVYRGPGGMGNAFDRNSDDSGGEWTPDPMHLTVIQELTYAVFGNSYMAGESVRDLIEATISQMRPVGSNKPPRFYGLPMLCVAQAIIALRPYFPEDAKRWEGYLHEILVKLDEDTVYAEKGWPVLMHKQAGDHIDIQPALVEAVRQSATIFGVEPEVVNEKWVFESGLADWFVVWMGGQLAGGLATALRVTGLNADTRHLAIKHSKTLAFALTQKCDRSKNTSMRAYDEPSLLINDIWAKTDFVKDWCPKSNLARPEDKHSLRGVFMSYLVPGMELLGREIPDDRYADALFGAVDSLVGSCIKHGYGSKDPAALAQAGWYEIALRRSLTE